MLCSHNLSRSGSSSSNKQFTWWGLGLDSISCFTEVSWSRLVDGSHSKLVFFAFLKTFHCELSVSNVRIATSEDRNMLGNPIALRMAKTLWSFGHFECNRVKSFDHSECNKVNITMHQYEFIL